ncbi:hypothetical protein, partial [Aeromonas veronii]|uniref:hypothetical protein n=1 Tax=Aeromonas veronii TaxID=654 RepID=UPI003D1F0D8C
MLPDILILGVLWGINSDFATRLSEDFWIVYRIGFDLNALLFLGCREFNFEVQFPIKNQAAFRSSSKTTC